MNKEQANELFLQVKTRFLAACKEIVLHRLKDVQDRFPEVDPDLTVELVILTGIGFLNRLDRHAGSKNVAEFFDDLLQELTAAACLHDEGLTDEIKAAAEVIQKRNRDKSSSQEEGKQVKVPISNPLPGIGLFGFNFSRGEN